MRSTGGLSDKKDHKPQSTKNWFASDKEDQRQKKRLRSEVSTAWVPTIVASSTSRGDVRRRRKEKARERRDSVAKDQHCCVEQELVRNNQPAARDNADRDKVDTYLRIFHACQPAKEVYSSRRSRARAQTNRMTEVIQRAMSSSGEANKKNKSIAPGISVPKDGHAKVVDLTCDSMGASHLRRISKGRKHKAHSSNTNRGVLQPTDRKGASSECHIDERSQPQHFQKAQKKHRKNARTSTRDSGMSRTEPINMRILFVDAGNELEAAHDRAALSSSEIVTAAMDLDTSVIIGTDFDEDAPSQGRSRFCNSKSIRTQWLRGNHEPTAWHVWYDDSIWACTSIDLQSRSTKHVGADMRFPRECAIVQLQHIAGISVIVMFMKNASCDDVESEEVLHAAFSFLDRHTDQPVIVAGEMGVGVAQLHAFMRKNKYERSVDSHCIPRQNFHVLCRTNADKKTCCTSSIATEWSCMMVHQIHMSGGDTHPTEFLPMCPQSAFSQRANRRRAQMTMLQQLTEGDVADVPNSEAISRTAALLYQPVAEQVRDKEGVLHTLPTDVEVSERTFIAAVNLLRKIRADIGVRADGTTLSKSQFPKAFQRLKRVFKEHFVISEKLQVLLRTEKCRQLNSREKKKFAGRFRGAFHAWLRMLLGDKTFVVFILRHGMLEASNMYACAELLRQKQNRKPPPPRNQELRNKALAARRALKNAARWRRWVDAGWPITRYQKHQIILMEIGQLLERVKEANIAYGYGTGSEPRLTKETAMTFEIFTERVLADYFRTSG